jgi:signal transduction histidine kinase
MHAANPLNVLARLLRSIFSGANPWSLIRVRLTISVAVAAAVPLLVWLPVDRAGDTRAIVEQTLARQRALAIAIAGLTDDAAAARDGGLGPTDVVRTVSLVIADTPVRVVLQTPAGQVLASLPAPNLPPERAAIGEGLQPAAVRVIDALGDRLIGYADVRRTGWRVVVIQDTDVTMQPINEARQSIIWLLMTSSALAGVGGMFLAWRIAKPLRAVTNSVERWRHGEPMTHLPRTGLRDVDTLVHALEDTRNALEAREQDLRAETHAREQADDMLRQRDQFLSIAAHELRTPVTVLKMGAQLMGRVKDDPERLDHALRGVIEGSGRLEKLVASLLDVSRIQTGRLQLEVGPVDLSLIVRSQMLPYAHRVVLGVRDSGCTLTGDETRLSQVVANLLSNADKYAPGNSPIVVSILHVEGGCTLTVTDQGIGLPPEEANRSFAPFARLTNAVLSNLPGMGLGLHISKQIAELHGGRVWLTSPGINRGATAHLWLPCRQVGGDQPGERHVRPDR